MPSPEVKQIYEDYLNEIKELEANRKPFEGLLGFGKRPDSDPCHDRFAERLGQELRELAQNAPSSGETANIMREMFEMPGRVGNKSVAYWMLIAVQQLAEGLIPFLTTEDASAISDIFEDKYPRYSQLPAQRKFAEKLLAQAGKKPRKGLFGFRNHS